MSDPVKSSEIEDVLASIRRLVTEEARGEKQTRRQTLSEPAPVAAEPAEADEPGADALVLTPALRVHEGGKRESVSESAEAEPDEAESADVEIPVAEIPDEAAASDARDWVDDDLAEAEADMPELPAETQTLETKIAALEALIANGVEERDAKVAMDVAVKSDDDAETLDWEDHSPESEAGEEGEWSDDLAEVDELIEDAEDTRDEGAEPVAVQAPQETAVLPVEEPDEEIAEFDAHDLPEEAASPVAETLDETEEAEHAENLSDEPELADAAPEDVDAEETTANGPLLPDSADAVTIDEEALRELVIEIVREELQGALGERITRNVRRLVRREIHRALASQELD